MSRSFITLQRRSLDSWLWALPSDQLKVALTLLMMANWKDGETFSAGELVFVKRGQIMTSLDAISARSQISKKTVRTALKNLEKTGFLANKSTNKFRLITIRKYDENQDVVDGAGHATGTQRARNGHATGTQRAPIEQVNQLTIEPINKKVAPSRRQVTEHQQFINRFHEQFRAANDGAKPSWGGRQAKKAKELLAEHGIATCIRRVDNMFAAPPPFPPPPYDWATFTQHFDKFAQPYSDKRRCADGSRPGDF